MTETPYLSVIIPVWNGEAELPKLLDALSKQTAPAESYEVIVVDNGSSDRTAEIATTSPMARLLSEPLPGSYRARNLGLNEARGTFVLFTDADCVPDPNWIENAIEICQQSAKNHVHAGRIVMFQEGATGRHAAMFESLGAFNQENNARKNHCVTANWLSDRAMLLAHGGFRADLLSGGDFEFSQRLSGQGVAIRYAPNLIVRHPTRSSLKGLVAKRRRVIGGAWTIEQGNTLRSWNLIKNSTMLFLYQAKSILLKDIPWKDKPAVLGIAAAFAATGLFEVARLSVGRPPHRS